MQNVTFKQIHDFLDQKRIALVGLSRNPNDFTRKLSGDLIKRNYDVIPVNPFTNEIDGRKCFSSVEQISPAPESAIIFTTSVPVHNLVSDCIDAGIKHIWVYNGKDAGQTSMEFFDSDKEKDINLITGHCPYMFMEDSGFFHKFHGFILKVTGAYPK